ncbi:uncharacterized protein LOC119266946 [Triticum dicoccoides]|uniref:uncharacterized protein LOC119266946 n=1 Tax=Triticum dicoccoides TaxID=85692 RepID=UPI00188F0FD1|nr:uncharacterized protein LOC119266946 [Triticum dicoccoides]
MADAAAAAAPDELNKWWETFNNGGAVEDEPMVDSDSDFEQGGQGAEEEGNAGVVAGECHRKVEPDAHAPAGREGCSGAARDCDEKEISEDGHFQLEGVLPGMKREAAAGRNTPRATAAEIQSVEGQAECSNAEYVSEDNYVGGEFQGKKRKATVTAGKLETVGSAILNKNAHGECLRAENQMLRLQLVRKTKELEAEQIRRLELELHFMRKENEFLKKQLEELKAENEYYTKTAKPQKTRRLCRFCKEYVDHDFRNCPERHASACSEEDDGSI